MTVIGIHDGRHRRCEGRCVLASHPTSLHPDRFDSVGVEGDPTEMNSQAFQQMLRCYTETSELAGHLPSLQGQRLPLPRGA
jgi:hypothetical protein